MPAFSTRCLGCGQEVSPPDLRSRPGVPDGALGDSWSFSTGWLFPPALCQRQRFLLPPSQSAPVPVAAPQAVCKEGKEEEGSILGHRSGRNTQVARLGAWKRDHQTSDLEKRSREDPEAELQVRGKFPSPFTPQALAASSPLLL